MPAIGGGLPQSCVSRISGGGRAEPRTEGVPALAFWKQGDGSSRPSGPSRSAAGKRVATLGGCGQIRAGALAVPVREGKSPGPTCTLEAELV